VRTAAEWHGTCERKGAKVWPHAFSPNKQQPLTARARRDPFRMPLIASLGRTAEPFFTYQKHECLSISPNQAEIPSVLVAGSQGA
jgi:hypothetical protein